MLRLFFSSLFICLSLFSASAETLDLEIGFTLRDAAIRGEIDTVENLLTEAQARYEAGEIPADQLRILNAPFAFTHPDMVTFIENWRRERPASPYAKIAEVWHLYRKSGAIRGERWARQTYPEALQRFRKMQQQAWDLAHEVYEAHPRMIHASDALLRLANGSNNQREALRALHATMAHDPNQGTLQRGLDMMLPGWGWHWEHVENLCDQYAALVEDPDPQPELTCKVREARWFDAESLDWMHREIEASDLAHLDYLRIGRTMYEVASRQDAVRLREHLMNGHGSEDYWSYFDSVYAPKYGLDLVHGPLARLRIKNTRELLEHDPYNIDYLETMLKPVMETYLNAKGKIGYRLVEKPSPEESLEYARRLVVASPYNPEFWKRLNWITHRTNPQTPLSQTRPYRINAIVYDNHSPASLHQFMRDQLGYRNALLKIERGKGTDKEVGTSSGVYDVEAFSDMDMEGDVLCPFIRAARLYDRICAAVRSESCDQSQDAQSDVLAIMDEVERLGACKKELSAPIDALLFSPIPTEDLPTFQSRD